MKQHEGYTPGEGWSQDFEYEDMLQAGIDLKITDDLDLMEKIVEDFTDVNYHREAAHLYDAIDALKAGKKAEARKYLKEFQKECQTTLDVIIRESAYMRERFTKLAKLTEDETQDKLDDLSAAFQSDSVEAYVSLLKKYQSDPKVAAVLKSGATDGKPNDEKFKVNQGNIAVEKLKPTQNEIGAEESLKNILTDAYGSLDGFLKGSSKFPEPIIVYNGEFILDGHHRWSQVYAANPKATIPAINVVGKFEPKDILKVIHTAIAVDAGATKTISANLKAGNLLDFNAQKVKKYVADELTDKARKVWNANGFESDDVIADKIAVNVETMISKSKPENWAPTRDHMPQPGVSGSEEWGKKMAGGTVNLISPKNTDVKKESVNKRLDKMLSESIIKLK